MFNLFKSWKYNEKGVASISLFILSLPLIVGSFGFGFDEVRGIYIRNYVQGRADLAVQNAVAATTTTTSKGNISLDANYVNDVINNYEKNTQEYRNNSILSCSSKATTTYNPTNQITHQNISSTASCVQTVWQVGTFFNQATACKNLNSFGPTSAYGVHFQVKEKINTIFLRILGINTINLGTINAESLIRPNCP